MKTLAIINQKGGVGKTTTVANLGAAIAARGKRLCLLDMDPQAHLTLHVGLEPGENTPGVYEVLTDNAPVSEAAVKINEHLSAIPAVIDLAAAETELVTVVGREQILNDKLAAAKSDYDFVMIDCPPSLGLLTLNALAAADYVFIPLQAHFLALQGLGMLLETVSLVQQRINPKLKVGGVILCMHERQTRLAGEVVADIEEFLEAAKGSEAPWANAGIFETPIRRNIKLAECPSYGKTIFDYDPYSHGALDYDSLAEEFMAFFMPGATPPTSPAAPAQEEPVTETSEPVEQIEEPVEDAAEVTAESSQPVQQSPEPVVETSEPVEQHNEPIEEAAEATVESSQPAQQAETSESIEESSETVDETPESEPVEDSPQPVGVEPGEFRSEPEPIVKPNPAAISNAQPTIGETD